MTIYVMRAINNNDEHSTPNKSQRLMRRWTTLRVSKFLLLRMKCARWKAPLSADSWC